MNQRLKSILETLGGAIVALLLWEAVVRLFDIPSFILPPPSAVIAEGVEKLPLLWKHIYETVVGTFISLAIGAVLGVSLGFIIGYSDTVSRVIYPLLGGFHALPKSAFIPILAVWFGVGFLPGIIAGALIAFFPIVVNVVTGLNTIEPELWEMLKILGASKFQVYSKVGIPRTVPYFFAALKIAAAGAFIGNVVGEMIAAGSGLGYVLLLATSRLDMALAFAVLGILLLVGMLLFISFEALERKAAPWAYRGHEVQTIGQ